MPLVYVVGCDQCGSKRRLTAPLRPHTSAPTGIFPGDPWELVFKVLDETGRALECAPPQIKVSLQPERRGVEVPLLQIRCAK